MSLVPRYRTVVMIACQVAQVQNSKINRVDSYTRPSGRSIILLAQIRQGFVEDFHSCNAGRPRAHATLDYHDGIIRYSAWIWLDTCTKRLLIGAFPASTVSLCWGLGVVVNTPG